jgi:tetratricopeptide (TPR) repeat protein
MDPREIGCFLQGRFRSDAPRSLRPCHSIRCVARHPRRLFVSMSILFALWVHSSAVDAVLSRTVPKVGEVLTVQGDDNTIRLIESPQKRWIIEPEQALATGDHLHTGPFGRLALIFDDRTQVRVHRDTDLEIRYAAPSPAGATSSLRLNLGAIWARLTGRVGQPGVRIEMPAATAAIRGTDWYAAVDAKKVTTLVVLTGVVRLYNKQGDILVDAGETATAEPGKAPFKRKTIRLADQPFIYLDLSMEWIDLLRIGAIASPGAGDDDPIAQAARLYDAGRFEETAQILARENAAERGAGKAPKSGARLLAGLLALRRHRFSEADELLTAAAATGPGSRRQVAELGRFGIAVETEHLVEAEHILSRLERGRAPIVEVGLARAWFEMLAGDYPAAGRRLESLGVLYPREARVWVLKAQLYTLEGDTEGVTAATDHALTLAPDYYLAWYWRGVELFKLNPNGEAALAAYDHVLELRSSYGPAWNDRAVLLTELGRDRKAKEAADRAVAIDPYRALFHATQGSIWSVAARRQEADAAFEQALSLEANQSDALRGEGVLRLEEGDNAAAIDLLRKAEVVDPENNDGTILLGVAEYQVGAVADARKILNNAARTDPNDPVPPLMLSVIAQDHALADAAILHAREAEARVERTGPIYVEGLASAQSGILNVGSAYANLGLDAWGGYLGQRSYSPYSANSQFFLANSYPSARAHDSLNLQGLLLDPTAASYNLRYTQFIREPSNELALGARGSTTDGGDGWGLDAKLQGFARLPTPLAYRFWAGHAEDDGFRPNSSVDTQRLGGAIGGWLDGANYFFARAQYHRDEAGLPGTIAVSDPDDQERNEIFAADLGLQHRIDAKNRILGRVQWRFLNQRLTNPTAANLGLSDLDFSLIEAFGLTNTHLLYSLGLYDASSSSINSVPGRVTLILGPAGEFSQDIWGVELPKLMDTIPSSLDLKPVASVEIESHLGTLQLRHLFEAGDWDLTYGVEAGLLEEHDATNLRVLSPSASGYITDARIEDSTELNFLYGSSELVEVSVKPRQYAGLAYVDGTWQADPDLSIQIGAYLRYLDDDTNHEGSQLDPHLGLAWQPADGHWLRAAAQRELILPIPDTLAPVTLVGLVPTDDYARLPEYIPGGVSHYSNGGSIEDYLLRWDAEWSPHLFTFAQGEQQDIDDYFQVIPWSGDWAGLIKSTIQLDSVRIRQLQVGTNLWLTGGIGVHARYTHNWSRILGSVADAGNRVPLVPDNSLDFGVTYVHPSQVRAIVRTRYLGKRWADTANVIRLDNTWLTDLSVNWQPKQRHWSLTAAVTDLFDSGPEVAAGIPAPGRTFLLSAEYRL